MKNLAIILPFITAAILTSCRPAPEKKWQNALETSDSADSGQDAKPAAIGYADINGLKMYYEVYGSGKPLVLLHGSYMSIPLNWRHIIPMFAKDRKVIVAEMQGHGRTRDISREVSFEGMADDVSGLLKHLKIDSADILGYSMGGGIAFQVAVRHPGQVRRLVVVSGVYAHDGWWPDVEANFARHSAELFKGTALQKQYDSLGNDPGHFAEFIDKVKRKDLSPYNWSREVNNIQAPVFMIIGDADGVRYEHALALFRAKGGGKIGEFHGLPKSRLAIIPGTSHIGMMQRADWLIPMITDFLDADLNEKPAAF